MSMKSLIQEQKGAVRYVKKNVNDIIWTDTYTSWRKRVRELWSGFYDSEGEGKSASVKAEINAS